MIQTVTAPPEGVSEIAYEDSLFDANNRQAAANHALLERHGITALELVGPIGSGKTTLITRLVERLSPSRSLAVINGDPATTEDVLPVSALGVPVVQIQADAGHLDASLVARGLERLPLASTDLIFIENVGNFIGSAHFALGSRARIVVISCTEGPWMVRKHPDLFRGARLVVINKQDLADAVEVDCLALARDVHRLKPDLPVVVASCRTGRGLGAVATILDTF